jgi:putative serine protease PepD
MTDEQRAEPASPDDGSTPSPDPVPWDPWSAGGGTPSDATAPLDLARTQEVDLGGVDVPPPTPEAAASYGPPAPGDEAASAPPASPSVPTWAAVRDDPAVRAAAGGSSAYGTYPASAPMEPGYGAGAMVPMTRQRPLRRGPGWGALVSVAAVAALVSGVGGGLLGGWLARSDATTAGTQNDPATVPTPGPAATSRPSDSVASIAARTLPSVVTIRVTSSAGTSTGSGWVYDTNGHLVTNNHVIADAGNGGKVTVILSNGKQSSGTVVGRDESYDLAVVKLDRTDLRPLPVGSSADVVVGDPVIAVGAPLGLDSTVTTGIVSALNRPVAPGGSGSGQSYINAIQTDAAINPGNSGGPLLDMSGRVIGVNSAIAQLPGASQSSTSGSIGLGFAIPSDQVRKTVDQLIAGGKAEHPVIGVLMDLSYTGEGVRIAAGGSDGAPAITTGGPADKAGLEPGDIILEIDGRPIADPDQLVVAIRAHSVGDRVTLVVRRDGTDREVTLVLAAAQ